MSLSFSPTRAGVGHFSTLSPKVGMKRALTGLTPTNEPRTRGSQPSAQHMSTSSQKIATARQASTGHVIAPSDPEDSTHVRRLPVERSARPRPVVEGDIELEGAFDLQADLDLHDTIPCKPPTTRAPARPNDLERTLRFARLVRDTLADDHPLTRLLELALMRRDAALLQGLLKELYRQQVAEASTQVDESPRRSERVTLLPPPPKSAEG